MSFKVIESMPQLGGQLSILYPEKYIYDVAGFPRVYAKDLIGNLIDQCSLFKPRYCLNEKVLNVTKDEAKGFFEVTTSKTIHYAKTIIIASGCGAFEPRRLTLENAKKYEKTNLYYFVLNKNDFKDKTVLIAGGGDSAVDLALMLKSIAKKVIVVHRREKFRAVEHSVDEMFNSLNIEVLTPWQIKDFYGKERIEEVLLIKNDKSLKAIKVDAVIVSFGFVSSFGQIKEWGLNISRAGIEVNLKMETNIDGIYAIGDVASYEGKVKLIAVGFGEAPIAVNHAKQFIDPAARLQPGHSSHMTF